jgi:hypothetical protein
MKNKILSISILAILAPLILHFSLFTWNFKGVDGDWLGFFGSYFGLLGAFAIASMQFNKQKTKEDQSDIINNRSFMAVHEFQAPIGIKRIKTHENSRIIETDEYIEFQKWIEESKYSISNISYYKLMQFGLSEVIFDCEFILNIRSVDGKRNFRIGVNLGVIEKGIEIFIPVAIKNEQVVLIDSILIEYTTMKGERIRFVHDLINKVETHSSITFNKPIMEYNIQGSKWIYPNKLTP